MNKQTGLVMVCGHVDRLRGEEREAGSGGRSGASRNRENGMEDKERYGSERQTEERAREEEKRGGTKKEKKWEKRVRSAHTHAVQQTGDCKSHQLVSSQTFAPEVSHIFGCDSQIRSIR